MDLPPMGVDEKLPILKKNMLSTGISDLDIVLEGGYQNPANILFLGPTGMEKAAFGFQFAAAADPKTESAFIICSDSSPANVISKAASLGVDLSGPNIYFVDCYTATLGSKKAPAPKPNIAVISGPGALNDLSLTLNEAINNSAGKRMRLVFYSLSTFVLYNPKESILKFLQVAGGRLKNAEATTLYLVEEGVHEKQLVSMLEHAMDGKYELQDKGGRFELHVPGLNVPVPVKLGPAGIMVL